MRNEAVSPRRQHKLTEYLENRLRLKAHWWGALLVAVVASRGCELIAVM